jgi:hypothetical protein
MNENARGQRKNGNSEIVERLEDPQQCRYCGRAAVVPVKDRAMDKTGRRGNPYRLSCLSCERHICMTSRENWETHEDRFVLTEDSGDVIPVFNCPSCGELVEGQPNECPDCGMSYNW